MNQIDRYDPLVSDRKDLNRIKYACRDFSSMVDDILRRLKDKYQGNYTDFATTSVALMLVDLVGWAHEHLQWNLDRTASDCFLDTVRTSARAESLVRQIGYKIPSASPSSTTLLLTFPNGTPSGFSMPARWRYGGPNGLVFESFAEILVNSPLTEGEQINVDVRQGETRVITYTSNGERNQSYRLTSVDRDKFLAVKRTEIWVDGSLWQEQDYLSFSKSNQYEISYLSDPPMVRFGDGIAGNIPPAGAEIKIRFVVIDGKKGNVKSNTINRSMDTLMIEGQQVVFTVNNESDASGGDDPEDVERSKAFAPLYFAARGAAVTVPDYKVLAGTYSDPRYGRVARAYAYNPRGSYEDQIFNLHIGEINLLIEMYRMVVDGLENSMVVSSESLSPFLDSLNSILAALTNYNDELQGYIGSALSGVNTSRSESSSCYNSALMSENDTLEARNNLDTLIAWVNASPSIPGGDKTILLNGNSSVTGLNAIRALVSKSNTESVNAKLNAGAISTALDNVKNVHLAPASIITNSYIPALIVQLTNDASEIVNIISGPFGLQNQVVQIQGLAEGLDSDINLKLTEMQNRIGLLFFDDCMSNYVQVPILALNQHGDYIAPSIGLLLGVQRYLDEMKEVTQDVEVIDGSSLLLYADINISLVVSRGYVLSDIESQVQSLISKLLRGRDFNTPLNLKDLYKKSDIPGVYRVNIEIVGPITSPPVIINGNLIPPSNRIIALGNLNISTVMQNEQ